MSTRFLLISLLAIAIIGAVVVGGWAIHRAGWAQGYALGQAAASGEGGVPAPYGSALAVLLLWGTGLFFTVAVLALLIGIIGKVFGVWALRTVMAGGPGRDYWASRWHRAHGARHPWCWSWEGPSEQKTEKADGPAGTGDAEAQT
jgi:hypothetical protein